MTVPAVLYLGTKRETPFAVTLMRTEPGIGAAQCSCPECEGTGDWTPYYPEPLPPRSMPCVACKGTGRIWVSY